MNNSELNRDNDQLVSTEEVSLEQSNVGNVSAANMTKEVITLLKIEKVILREEFF